MLRYATLLHGREFSGVGFVKVVEGNFEIYDAVILAAGTEIATEIQGADLLQIIERDDAKRGKVWIHGHPCGNGQPGPHNWSATDEHTIRTRPLGNGDPKAMEWSLSIVLTPNGWVGRWDYYVDKKPSMFGKEVTLHLEVSPDYSEIVSDCIDMLESVPFKNYTAPHLFAEDDEELGEDWCLNDDSDMDDDGDPLAYLDERNGGEEDKEEEVWSKRIWLKE